MKEEGPSDLPLAHSPSQRPLFKSSGQKEGSLGIISGLLTVWI